MSQKSKKQFGVWLDTHHATIVGRFGEEISDFIVLGYAKNEGAVANSSEKNVHNEEKTLQQKYFKDILSHMQNADEVHITGTGTSQEQLMHYMAETPQYKNTKTSECTSNKMSDERLLEFISGKFG